MTHRLFSIRLIASAAMTLAMLLLGTAQAQQQMVTALAESEFIPSSSHDAGYALSDEVVVVNTVSVNDNTVIGDSTRDSDGRGTDSDVGLVDWIELQLRVVASGAPAPTAPLADDQVTAGKQYRFVAWLLSDGSIVNPDTDIAAINADTAVAELTIPADQVSFEPTTEDLYLLVSHRNHLAIMSAAPLITGSDVYEYDFSTSADQAFRSGLKDGGGNGQFAMFGGLVTPADATINVVDALTSLDAEGERGYAIEDANFTNATVDVLDALFVLGNEGQVPLIGF